MVLPRFVKQALEGQPITVYGDGTQTRTFTHVTDVAKVLVTLLDVPEAIGEVINIGGTEEVSILELAERVKARAESTSEIQLHPYSTVYPKDFEDMQRRVPSTDKLKRLIGYAPSMKLAQILDDTIHYQRLNRCTSVPTREH
jgi:UDP-glucose 4-epimerase